MGPFIYKISSLDWCNNFQSLVYVNPDLCGDILASDFSQPCSKSVISGSTSMI